MTADGPAGDSPRAWASRVRPAARAIAIGILGGIVVGITIAVILDSIPTANEQRLLTSALVLVGEIAVAVFVAAFALVILLLDRRAWEAGLLVFAVSTPIATLAVSDLLWRQAIR